LKIVIIGGGIVGLSLSDQLVRQGAETTLLEANTIASGASGVATSYIEPRLGKTPLRLIEQEAHRRWPDYATALHDETGIDPVLSTTGQIRVATEQTREELTRNVTERREAGWRIKPLSSEAARKLEPSLSPDIAAAAHAPDVLWVDGKAVCKGLAKRVRTAGGTVLEGHRVATLHQSASGLDVICENGTTFTANRTVVCCGMGQHTITGMPDDIPQTRPVRGVNLILDMAAMAHPIRHLIKHKLGTLCPRPGQQLLVGTTYDHGEADLTVSKEVIGFLLANAEPILPSVRNLPLLAATAGLRTKVSDGNLAVGTSQQNPAIAYSLGHSGSGYLRTPVIAEATAGYVLKGDAGPLLGPLVRG